METVDEIGECEEIFQFNKSFRIISLVFYFLRLWVRPYFYSVVLLPKHAQVSLKPSTFSKFWIEAPDQSADIIDFILVSLLLTLNIFHFFSRAYICEFEQGKCLLGTMLVDAIVVFLLLTSNVWSTIFNALICFYL